MRRAATSLVALALLGACDSGSGASDSATPRSAPASRLPGAAHLSSETPKRQTCPEWHPPKDRDYGEHEGPPPKIDRAFASIVSASRTVITVEGLVGKPACIELSWIDEVDQFSLSADKRFLDFGTDGFEAYGHILVDRRNGQWVDTGDTPLLSDDETMVAAVQMTISQMGSLEGVGVWRVVPGGFVEVAKIKDMPNLGGDYNLDSFVWGVDRWVGNRCAEISAVSQQAYDAAVAKDKDPRDMKALPWHYYKLSPVGGKWRLQEAKGDGSCGHQAKPA